MHCLPRQSNTETLLLMQLYSLYDSSMPHIGAAFIHTYRAGAHAPISMHSAIRDLDSRAGLSAASVQSNSQTTFMQGGRCHLAAA